MLLLQVNWFNHYQLGWCCYSKLTGLTTISWVDVVTPIDRPQSVCNHCVIEVFGGVIVLSLCFFEFSARAFVIGQSLYTAYSISYIYIVSIQLSRSLFLYLISSFFVWILDLKQWSMYVLFDEQVADRNILLQSRSVQRYCINIQNGQDKK